jgi:hypothetical protein
MIINESLRVEHGVGVSSFNFNKDVQLGQYKILKHTPFIINLDFLHNDRK